LERAVENARTEERRRALQEELDGPPAPEGAEHLWDTFMRISTRRGSTGFGAAPLSWSDLDAFVRMTRCPLSPWEIEVIERLDDLFMAEQARAVKAGK
jgi:hypothetical protein